MHSGKFAPIPDHYSDDLKLLIDSLIRKTPASRPEVIVRLISAHGLLCWVVWVDLRATNNSNDCTWRSLMHEGSPSEGFPSMSQLHMLSLLASPHKHQLMGAAAPISWT